MLREVMEGSSGLELSIYLTFKSSRGGRTNIRSNQRTRIEYYYTVQDWPPPELPAATEAIEGSGYAC